VHFPLGNDGTLQLGEWLKQQVKDSNSKAFMAFVNNFSGWLGLNLSTKYSIGCVKNITSARPLPDALGRQLVARFGVGRKPTRWFMSRDAKFYLQSSRSATLAQKDSGRGDGFASIPTSLADIPIQETDSIATRAAT